MGRESSLEPDAGQSRAWLDEIASFVLEELEAIGAADNGVLPDPERLALASRIDAPIPEQPAEGPTEALATLRQALTASLPTPHSGYLAYVPGGGLYAAALADLVANVTNRYTGLAAASPALCRLEADVLRWLASEFGYGPEARGLLTTGGSMANFSAIVTARHTRLGEGADLRRATAYTSAQIHHSVAKSLAMAGIPRANLREVAVDERFRLRPDALAQAVAQDREAGLEPFLVVASAGTTNTGAVDPLSALADLCRDERMWFHVDGAYGGAFQLCDEGRRVFAGIERADSIVFDPHKGMFLPYGTGCLLVREGQRLREAHSQGADYLQDLAHAGSDELIPSPTEYGPELSRDFRGLRLWLPLQLHGAAAFRHALTEKLALARRAADGLRTWAAGGVAIEIVDEPQLSTVPFRLARRDGEALTDWNRRNAALLAGINARRRVYLSSTNLPVEDGAAFTLRICVLSFRTHAAHIDACVEDVRSAALDLEA